MSEIIRFNSDYTEGCHPAILEKLSETNMVQTPGYGEDEYCAEAAGRIKEACKAPEADVHFLVGGTQTNVTVISAALKHYQGVITAQSGHINVHETGALEACGHKCLVLESPDGKLTAVQVAQYTDEHFADESFEHMVQPKMVYISNPTELGTIYYKKELEELYAVCRKYNLFLYMDGARMGYGLAAADNDLTLAEIAGLCDVFYIGGTKVGALFGEALVITNPLLKEDFRYMIKQKGGMLAKGRLLGVQFQTLFEDSLYLEMAKHADGLADEIRKTLKELQIPLLVENETNQIFPIVPDSVLETLREKYSFSYIERVDEAHSAIRLCTSWVTTPEAVETLCMDLKKIFQA